MPPSREPWIKMRVGLRRSDKVGLLPSDSARWAWVCVLLEAKLQRHMGVFVSRRHFVDVLGRQARYLDDFVRAGLAHQAPNMCHRCAREYEVDAGAIVVHDFRREQRDPTNADRQASHREAIRNEDSNTPPTTIRNEDSNEVRHAHVAPSVTPHSRARGTTETETETEREIQKGVLGLRPSSRGRAREAAADAPRVNGEERDASIARARAALADPATSPAIREAAIAQLNQLGAPLEELDFGADAP